MILDVYVHIYSADDDKVFIAAIAADGRSYRDAVMTEARGTITKPPPAIRSDDVADLRSPHLGRSRPRPRTRPRRPISATFRTNSPTRSSARSCETR